MKLQIDREIAKLTNKGIIEAVDLLLISHQSFKILKFELQDFPLTYHSGLNKYYIEYRGLKILPYSRIIGDSIFPYINPTKLC